MLVLIIFVFFTPFFFVSCGGGDSGTDFSGFELSTGKYVGGYWQAGNPFGFMLIVLPAAALALSFLHKKNAKIQSICRYLFFIAPIFDIFAGLVAWRAFKSYALAKIGQIPVTIGTRPGFVLYIAFNIALFAAGVADYFAKRE